MKPSDLVLRCYAENSQGYWAAYCLDLTLYATGETFEESREKLDQEICGYVDEALIGEDKAFAGQLLKRRAPVSCWLRYYGFATLVTFGAFKDSMRKFTEGVPLKAGRCHPL